MRFAGACLAVAVSIACIVASLGDEVPAEAPETTRAEEVSSLQE